MTGWRVATGLMWVAGWAMLGSCAPHPWIGAVGFGMVAGAVWHRVTR